SEIFLFQRGRVIVWCMPVVPRAGIGFGLWRGPKLIAGSGALCWSIVTGLTPASERLQRPGGHRARTGRVNTTPDLLRQTWSSSPHSCIIDALCRSGET
ncbi:MAG TPA: hypothetical protein VMU64_02075, partial [Acidimicrobiales bacterium]|nr:hypothetical protein [Acidimicrobiales bacterium]